MSEYGSYLCLTNIANKKEMQRKKIKQERYETKEIKFTPFTTLKPGTFEAHCGHGFDSHL